MTEYWKSNPKKFCEICKCWLANNAITINNHENGLRHKANVQKKLSDIRKNSKESNVGKMREKISLIDDMAFVGMMKDIERDPSLAKRYGITLSDETLMNMKQKLSKLEKKKDDKHKKSAKCSIPRTSKGVFNYEWKEVKSTDGKIYYWNKKNGLTQWERPATSVEPVDDSQCVQKEKQRLDQFVFNRLVELSESGHSGANEAVCQAFDAEIPSLDEPKDVERPSSCAVKDIVDNISNEKIRDEAATNGTTNFTSKPLPKVNLLGAWQPVLPEPECKVPKLDLPSLPVKTKREPAGKIKLNLSFGGKDRQTAYSQMDEKSRLLAMLAEVNEQNIHESKHPEFQEKHHAVSATVLKEVNLKKLESCLDPKHGVKMDSDAGPSSAPAIAFKRKLNPGSRNIRLRKEEN